MYERFFGLKERPFDLTPNPRFLGLTATHREALGNLRLGLTTARGVTLLAGEAGTGKTTLLHTVLSELEPDFVECVLISNPTLKRDEFFEYLADAFGLRPEAHASKTQFLFAFRRHLEERHLKGRLTAIILDEAQSLPHELLEEVRLLSNIETPSHKLLNVVLSGQPELAHRLNDPALRQLKQRISLRCVLAALSLTETAAYIAGRLRIAGGRPADVFSQQAVAIVHEMSGGIPRLINVICDNALIGAFAANVKPISKAILLEVMKDFDLDRNPASAAAAQPAQSGAATEPIADSAPAADVAGAAPEVVSTKAEAPGRKRRFSFF